MLSQVASSAHGLTDQVVVITGGAQGIGFACAQAFAREGARIALLDIDARALDLACASLREFGAKALALQASVSDAQAVSDAFAAIDRTYGRVDVLINNAGISANKPTLDVTAQEWHRAVDINLNGVFFCAQAAGRRMVAQGAGSIVNMSSMYGVVAAPDRAAYCATKGAVVMLTETLALEWGKLGIRVNALAPGYIDTDLLRDLHKRGRLQIDQLVERTPLRRLGTADEIAEMALFLAGTKSAFVTGHTLVADGGWSRNAYL
ncbi:MAG TPA: short-chain dehydrogenase [Advenella kashmirensis]|uniref:Short-chain dehydrogenase n=1 Tax=Advenella kashmirensis TaxID=310575 RepID=A0A356LGP9_9BURK|nr:short-chain dehydrogenase [Advenella kashmirensis]